MRFGYDFLTIGGATEDIFFTVDDFTLVECQGEAVEHNLIAFPYGSKVGVPSVTTAYGGGASNAAVALSRLGFRVAILGTVGHDRRGHSIIHNLQNNNVQTRLVQIKRGQSSGVSFVAMPPGHDHLIFTHRGANDQLHLGVREKKEIRKARNVYLTSLSGAWKKLLPTIFASARTIAWNPGRLQIAAGLKTLQPYLQQTHVLLCNKSEALELVSSVTKHLPQTKQGNLRLVVQTLKKYVPGWVIITNGEQGTLAYDGHSWYRQPIIKAKKVVDTTGVGDAFGASLVAGLQLYPDDMTRALRVAAQNASAVVGSIGAQTGLLRKEKLPRS